MPRFLFVCVGWLILEAILLRGAAAFLPADPSLLRSSDLAPAFVQADFDPPEVLFKENSSVSQELSLLCKQAQEQSCTLTPSVDPLQREQERDDRWAVVHTRVVPLAPMFFPRQFSSASAEDGPFPS